MDTKWKQLLLSSPKPEFTTGIMKWGISLLFSALCTCSFAQTKYQITVETLLKEMTSRDEMSRYPALPYRSMQQSSYDRRPVYGSRPLAAYIQSYVSILTEKTNRAGRCPLMISRSSVCED